MRSLVILVDERCEPDCHVTTSATRVCDVSGTGVNSLVRTNSIWARADATPSWPRPKRGKVANTPVHPKPAAMCTPHLMAASTRARGIDMENGRYRSQSVAPSRPGNSGRRVPVMSPANPAPPPGPQSPPARARAAGPTGSSRAEPSSTADPARNGTGLAALTETDGRPHRRTSPPGPPDAPGEPPQSASSYMSPRYSATVRSRFGPPATLEVTTACRQGAVRATSSTLASDSVGSRAETMMPVRSISRW